MPIRAASYLLVLLVASTASGQQLLPSVDSLIANYQFEQALRKLGSLEDTLNMGILQRRGLCQLRLGLTKQSIQSYERIAGIDSTNLSALNQLGQLYSREGEFAKAQFFYWKLIDIDSTNSYYYKQCAFVSAKLEEMPLAKGLYEKTLKLNPGDNEASLALGAILMELQMFDQLDSMLATSLVLDPQNRALLLLKAKSKFEQDQYKDVIVIVNGLLEKTDTAAAYARLLGASYFHVREYKPVLKCMSFLVAHEFESEWIYYYRAVANRELGNIDASIEDFKRAVDKSISDNTSTYYSQLAQTYEDNKDYQNAIRAYRAAYDNSKEGIFLYHVARNMDYYYKDKTEAISYYKRYLASDDTVRLAKEYSKRRISVIDKKNSERD